MPRADRQQNEYLPASEERLGWLTGFTGSAGAAIVLAERAVLFVDGRYTVQVKTQTDGKIFDIEHLVECPPDQWLEKNLQERRQDRLRSPAAHHRERRQAEEGRRQGAGATLVALDDNLIDALWKKRPAPPPWSGDPARHQVRRREQHGESCARYLRRARQAACRRAGRRPIRRTWPRASTSAAPTSRYAVGPAALPPFRARGGLRLYIEPAKLQQ